MAKVNIMNNIQFLESISPLQAEQVAEWLKEDKDQKTGIGLYEDWACIRKDIDAKNCLIALIMGTPIGFITYSRNRNIGTINYAGVQKKYRKIGIGRKLSELVVGLLAQKGLLVVDLFCAPPETRNFWQKIGFSDALKSSSSHGPRMYSALTAQMNTYQKEDSSATSGEFFQLWDNPSHLIKQQPPIFTWKLEFPEYSRKLSSPIISPCLPDWQLRHIVDGQIISNQKVSRHKMELYQNDFLIVTHL